MSEQRTQDDAIAEKPADTKPCPVCGETIKVGAKKCIHCDEFIEKDWLGFKRKTLWDIFGLLIIPLALAGMGFWFANFQDKRDIAREDNLREIQTAEATARFAVQTADAMVRQTAQTEATSTREAEYTAATATNVVVQSTVEANYLNENALEAYFDDISRLSRNNRLSGNQFHPERFSFPFEVLENAFPILLFIVVLTGINIVLAILKHKIDHARQFMGGGDHGGRSAMFGANPTIESARAD